MKSKPLTYSLIAVVVVLWGVIARKILAPPPAMVTLQQTAKPPVSKPPVDEGLLLNYRDPFGVSPSQTVAENDPMPIIQPIPVQPSQITRENIIMQCVGKITKAGVPRYLITNNGSQHIIKKGEQIDGFCLKETFADSLLFSKNGNTYCVKTEH